LLFSLFKKAKHLFGKKTNNDQAFKDKKNHLCMEILKKIGWEYDSLLLKKSEFSNICCGVEFS